jgi:hypothetical protein
MKTKMKYVNKLDNSVKLPWTIYKGFNVNPSKNENNLINEQLNENIPGMWY